MGGLDGNVVGVLLDLERAVFEVGGEKMRDAKTGFRRTSAAFGKPSPSKFTAASSRRTGYLYRSPRRMTRTRNSLEARGISGIVVKRHRQVAQDSLYRVIYHLTLK